MMGTLATVLAGKKIRTFRGLFHAEVTGDIEDVDGILKIVRINVSYRLRLPDDQRDAAMDCFDNYIHRCPAAQSVIGCIDVNHQIEMEAVTD